MFHNMTRFFIIEKLEKQQSCNNVSTEKHTRIVVSELKPHCKVTMNHPLVRMARAVGSKSNFAATSARRPSANSLVLISRLCMLGHVLNYIIAPCPSCKERARAGPGMAQSGTLALAVSPVPNSIDCSR